MLRFSTAAAEFWKAHFITTGQRVGNIRFRCSICLLNTICRRISVFATHDGSCCCSTSVVEVTLAPPEGQKDGKASGNVWAWKRLEIVELGEVNDLSDVVNIARLTRPSDSSSSSWWLPPLMRQ